MVALGPLLAALGTLLAALGSHLVSLEPLLAALGPLLDRSWSLLGRSGCDPGGVLKSPWIDPNFVKAPLLSICPNMGLVLLDSLPRRPNHALTDVSFQVSKPLRFLFRHLFR